MERGRRSAPRRAKRLSAAGRKLLPASMEGRWHPEEVWRVAYLVESSWHSSQFSDTPEWWVRLTPYFPGSTIHDLRRLHVSMIRSQMDATGWTPQEIQRLVAAVCSNMRPGTVDTPEWWALVAARLPAGRTALDARLTYNSLFYSHRHPSPLPNWTLDDYVLLMKVLTRNLAVDVADAAAMERIAALLPGKTAAEVRHLIVHWRPHLLAALAKADRVVAAQGSSSSSSAAGPSSRSLFLAEMSENAMRDVLTVSEFEKQSENFLKENLSKPFYADSAENFDNLHNVNSASFTAPQLNGFGVKSNEAEVGNAEVEYVETENLTDLPSADIALKTLVTRLDSKDWVAVCEALNNVRQLSIYHKEDFSELLGNVIPRIVKSLKSPRSAVCKTAVMTSADIFKVYKDSAIDFLDPLLVQLLLKSSQDKRFVCEASEKALIAMTTCISPSLLLPKLPPYLKDKNPRIRAKASMCFSRIFPRLGIEEIKAYGINELIRIASAQLNDQLPESREAARSLVLQLRSFYEKSLPSLSSGEGEGDPSQAAAAATLPWEDFCHTQLSALSAQAILRVT